MIVILSAVPQKAPNITQVTALNETSVWISWEGISLDSFAGAPQGYLVVYHEKTTSFNYHTVMVHGLVNFTTIKGLHANTAYVIHVHAVNVFAHGPPSDPAIVKTPNGTFLLFSFY